MTYEDCKAAGRAHDFNATYCMSCGIDTLDFLVANGTISIYERLVQREHLEEIAKRHQQALKELVQKVAEL